MRGEGKERDVRVLRRAGRTSNFSSTERSAIVVFWEWYEEPLLPLLGSAVFEFPVIFRFSLSCFSCPLYSFVPLLFPFLFESISSLIVSGSVD